MTSRQQNEKDLVEAISQLESLCKRLTILWGVISSWLAAFWAAIALSLVSLAEDETRLFAIGTLVLVGGMSIANAGIRIVLWLLQKGKSHVGNARSSGHIMRNRKFLVIQAVLSLAFGYGVIALAHLTLGEGSRDSLEASLLTALIVTVISVLWFWRARRKY